MKYQMVIKYFPFSYYEISILNYRFYTVQPEDGKIQTLQSRLVMGKKERASPKR